MTSTVRRNADVLNTALTRILSCRCACGAVTSKLASIRLALSTRLVMYLVHY